MIFTFFKKTLPILGIFIFQLLQEQRNETGTD